MADIRTLKNSLRDEIALAGDEGLAISKIWELVESSLSKDVTCRAPISLLADPTFDEDSLYDDVLPPSPLDIHLKRQIWKLIQADEDLRVGKPNEEQEADLTLEEADGGECRMFASSKLVWNAIAGHDEDPERVSSFQWKLLVIIAAAGPKGISQVDLVSRSGQDKRTVPARTYSLAENGYIDKRPIQLPKCRTSLLTLKRFAQGEAEEEDVKKPTQENAKTQGAVPFDLNKIVETMMHEIKSARNGVMLRSDLRKKLGYENNRMFNRIFKVRIRRMEQIGCIRRIMVPKDENSTSSSRTRLLKCLKFERDLEPADWKKVLQSVEALNLDEGSDDEDEEVVAATTTTAENQAEEAMPTWSRGDMQLAIFDVIKASGQTGILGIDLIQKIGGPFMYRPMEKILTKLATAPDNAIKPSMRHLKIVRQSDQSGRMFVYKYWTEAAYLDLLRSKNVPDVPEVNIDGLLDDKGFEIVGDWKPGLTSFLESQANSEVEIFDKFSPSVERAKGVDGRDVIYWDRPKKVTTNEGKRTYRKGKRAAPAQSSATPSKKRGRPRKPVEEKESENERPPPRKRGRPKKQLVDENATPEPESPTEPKGYNLRSNPSPTVVTRKEATPEIPTERSVSQTTPEPEVEEPEAELEVEPEVEEEEEDVSVPTEEQPPTPKFTSEDGVELEVVDVPEAEKMIRPPSAYLQLSRESLLTAILKEMGGAACMVRAFDAYRTRYKQEHAGAGSMDRKTFNSIADAVARKGLQKQITVQKGNRMLGRILADRKISLSSEAITQEKEYLVKAQDITVQNRSRTGKRVQTDVPMPIEVISYDRVYPTVKGAPKGKKASEERKATLQRIKNAAMDDRGKKKNKKKEAPQKAPAAEAPKTYRQIVPKIPEKPPPPTKKRTKRPVALSDDSDSESESEEDVPVPPSSIVMSSYMHSPALRETFSKLQQPSVGNLWAPVTANRKSSTAGSHPPVKTYKIQSSKPHHHQPRRQQNPKPTKTGRKPGKIVELERIQNFGKPNLEQQQPLRNENEFRKESIPIPRPRRNRKIDTFDDKTLILAVVTTRSVFGGPLRTIRWDIVRKVFPDLGEADLKRNWVRVRTNEKARIDRLQKQFEELYIGALDSGEVPVFDKEDLETFDLEKHVSWFDSVADESNTSNGCMDLPADRSSFDREYRVTSYSVPDWREPMFNLVSTLTLRREKLASQPFSIPYAKSPPPTKANLDVDRVKRAAKSLLLTDDSKYKTEAALQFLDDASDDVVKPAFSQLSDEKLVINAKGGSRIRNHSINSKFFFTLRTAINEGTFDQAMRFDRSVRETFAQKGEDELSALVSNGTMAWTMDMLAARKVKLEFGKKPLKQTPMGLIDNYQTRGMDSELINFDLVLKPTKDFDSHVVPQQQHPDIPTGKLNFKSAQSLPPPLCIWQDSNEKVILGMWHKVLKSVLSILILRPGATENIVQSLLKPLLNDGDATRAIAWLAEVKAVRKGDCGGYFTCPKFYSILNYSDEGTI